MACAGPHPGYDHDRAKADGNVTGDPARGVIRDSAGEVVVGRLVVRVHGSMEEALARVRKEAPEPIETHKRQRCRSAAVANRRLQELWREYQWLTRTA